MLKVEHVTKYYDNLCAVNDLSFCVKSGEIFGLLGVNGAGKTTTFRMIMGLIDSDCGSITLNGKKIDYSVTDQIGFLTEERSLLLKMTVFEQCIFYGTLKGMEKNVIEKRVDVLLKRFGIEDYKNKKIKELSKGNQQKIQFICAVLNNPKLLILDEPFSGLDPINIELFKDYILEMAKNGSSIIFSSHRMDFVEYFCEKIVVLVHGKSVLEGNISEIKNAYRKKNILICGDIDVSSLEKLDGVLFIEKIKDCYKVKISDSSYVKDVFKSISKCSNVTKFVVEEPTLNEIFVTKVGEAYEK